MAEQNNTATENKITLTALRNVLLNVSAALVDFGNFENEKVDEKGQPVLDEKGKPVLETGAAYVEVKTFAPFDALKELAAEIIKQGGRGIPTETQLATAQAALDAVFADVPQLNGRPNMNDAGWRKRIETESAKVAKLQTQLDREIAAAKKADEEKAAKEKAEAEAKAKAEAEAKAKAEADKKTGAGAK